MECNKDEAIRVRDIAELKFKKGDLVGAKKFVLKALRLYSCLDGAIQLSAVLDVHITAQVEVGINEPEPDYYGILQVKPLSDDSTIKKQYRNLSKLVHPDKNKKSMKEESEVAFKLIAEAFRVLSDKKTRSQHDWKQGEELLAKEPPNTFWTQPTPAPGAQASRASSTCWPRPTPAPGAQASQASSTFWRRPTPAPGAQASQASSTIWPRSTPAPGAQASQAPYTFLAQASPTTGTQAFQAPYTFWTACPFCRMQYQCMRIFLNLQVVCQNCHSSFPANDISVHPANWASAFVWPPGLWGNNNLYPAGSWANRQMNRNYPLAPAYGASRNGTPWNDRVNSIFSDT